MSYLVAHIAEANESDLVWCLDFNSRFVTQIGFRFSKNGSRQIDTLLFRQSGGLPAALERLVAFVFVC